MAVTVFKVAVEPVNDHIKVGSLEGKLRLIAGGVGLRVVSCEPVSQIPEKAEGVENEHQKSS